MFDIKPKPLYHWYRNHLSDYKSDIEQGKWQKDKIPKVVDEQNGEILSESPVYIVSAEKNPYLYQAKSSVYISCNISKGK